MWVDSFGHAVTLNANKILQLADSLARHIAGAHAELDNTLTRVADKLATKVSHIDRAMPFHD
jgi:hypothetical protein